MGVKYINGNLAVDIPLGGSSCPSSKSKWNLNVCFRGGSEEKKGTQRKTLEARTRTNNKPNPLASALTTTISLLL